MKSTFKRTGFLGKLALVALAAVLLLPSVAKAQYSGGSGTAASPYLISSESDLRTLATNVNNGTSYAGQYFRLTTDISMSSSFVPIGTNATYAFSGTFWGDGHTISNLTMTNTGTQRQGLFGCVRRGWIDSVKVRGTVTGADSTGGIVGSLIYGTVKGCTNYATIAGSYTCHGGIVGSMYYGRVINCRNEGSNNAVAQYNQGGIVGFARYASTIRNCVNVGTISGSSYYHGGIVGHFLGAASALHFVDTVGVFNCINRGSVTGSYYTGGIAGRFYYIKHMRNCVNSGTVTGTMYSAGIAGYSYGSSSYHPRFTRCVDSGNVTSTSYYVGGIVGYGYYLKVDSCMTHGTITTSYTSSSYLGGIVGYSYYTLITNSRTDAAAIVQGYTYVGGIAGYFYYDTMINCTNRATVRGYNSSNQSYRGGLAGYSYGSSTYKLYFENCHNFGSVTGASYIGGLTSYAYYGTARQCSNFGAITSTGYVGGILGQNYGYFDIYNCSNHGNITSTGVYTGGIVGYCYSNSTYKYLQYCTNTGHITSSSYYVGGILGYGYYIYTRYNTNSGDVTSTYASGSAYVGGIVGYGTSYTYAQYNLNGGLISAKADYVGGICGYSYGSTYTTYNLNVNRVSGGSYTAAIAGSGAVNTSNNYWDKQMCPTTYVYSTTTTNNATLGRATADFLGVSTYPGTGFTAVAGLYPIPTGLQDSLGAKLAATPINLVNDETVNRVSRNFTVSTANGVAWSSSMPSAISVSGTNATVNGPGLVTLTGRVNGWEKHLFMMVEPSFCGGSGTQADPYLICTPADLDTLAQFVNGGMDFEGKYFKVVNNLNMSGYPNFRIIGNSVGNPFKGHFDGNGRTISNLTVSSTASYCGLFGAVKGTSANRADVHDLVLRGSISGGSYTGAIVGRAEYTDITNITNYAAVSGSYSYHGGIMGYGTYCNIRRVSNRANVTGSSNVGGIAGYMINSGNYLENSVNGGRVTGSSNYVGGIVGYMSSVYVQYCSNSGTVTNTYTGSNTYTGGIAGYAGYYVRYCLNGGLVESKGGYNGGIAGYSSSSSYITYNLNVNNVRGLANTAAIVGYGSATTTTNYWDKQMCPTDLMYQTTSLPAYAKTTQELLNGGTVYPSTSYFTRAGGLYPVPTNVKDSLISKLAATPVNLASGEDVADVQTNFTVSTANSVVWTNDNPNSITVSGTNATLRLPGINMLSGTVQNMVKNVRIVSEPKFCGGSGTQLDPYLICTANTLDTLAIYTNQGMDFAGRYFLVVNDLNLSSFSNWRVIGESNATPFKGHFDGGRHTISGLTVTGTTNYRGLFGYVLGASQNDKAEIHDFTLRGSVNGGSYTGGVVGYCDYTRLYNLKNYATVAPTSYSYHGGIAGEAYYYCDFDSCENHGTVQGSSYTGGIAGYCDYYDKFRDCHNYGDITGSSYSGGIAGRNYYYGLFRNCSNSGDLSVSSYSAGICGYPYYYDTMINCTNTGDVTTSASYVGGIAGYKYYYGYIQNCENSGKVTGSSYLGGIVGEMYSYQYISNCRNTGDVQSTSCYVGGIIGYFSGNSSDSNSIYKIENCPNTGNVSGTYAVGGIAGYTYYCRTRNCDNRGDVTGTSYQVGGIAGYNYYYSIISYCNNYGNVTSSSTSTSYTSSSAGVGGIAGASYYGSAANVASIHHCNNYGNVTSTGYTTGGIVGMNYYYGHCKYNFNHGNVTGTYYVGGVCGMMYNTTNTTELNDCHIIDCGNSGDVRGTYYVGGVIGRNGYTSGYYYYTIGCVNTGRVTGDYYVGGIAGYNYGYNSSTYRSVVRGCLNAGIVTANTNYAGGICGYTYSSTYAIQEYNLNVGNVICSSTYKGGVDGYSYAPTSCYFDTLMCPVQYYYYGSSATTTTGKRTSALTDGSFNPSATYFTAQSGLYPRPTAIANHPMTLLAATPVFLDETVSPLNTVNNVTTCYTVGTRNNVSWSSDDPTVTTITGSDGSILSRGSAVLTAVKDTVITKDVDIEVTALPNFNTFTYPAINDTIGHPISGIRPSLGSGCTFFSNDLPEGLSINASTGEISGTVLDTLNTTFTVISSCTGCRMYQATVSIHIVPDITCAGYTVTLPAGETWYYDREFTQPVGGNTAVVNNNTTFYARGRAGAVSTDFNYTGTVQQYRVPAGADSLRFQVWGAQGGWRSSATYGGKGGYSEGTLTNLNGLSTLYVYVGGSGSSQTTMTSSVYPGGWNGGGYRYSYKGGGGASDISLQGTAGSTTWNSSNHLYSRIIVAGGGGSDGGTSYAGACGGGTNGVDASGGCVNSTYCGYGGHQTYSGYSSAYTATTQTTTGLNGTTSSYWYGGFGFGGGGTYYSSGYGGAGGGGWYGGSGTCPDGSVDDDRGGGGGSGYVYTASTAGDYPSGCLLNSNLYLTNAQTIAGNTSFEAPAGGVETGHEGNGYARINAYYSQCKYYIVNTLPRVSARISGDTTICNGTATLTIRFTGGAPYRYRITGDNADRTANADVVTIQVSPTTSTLYYVTFAKSTATGCEAVPDDLTGIGIVEVCGSAILCAGDSLTLPSGYTWYTDSRLSNQIPGGIVCPTQNTTYYRSGATYIVTVLDRGTATILDTVYNICSDSTAEVIINFTGLPPFTYRITGDRTDRVTNSNTVRVPVTTDTSAIVKVTYFSDLNSRCSGVITHSHAKIILCDQPIICYGDTVWLPAGQWYYDPRMTRPVTTPYLVPDQTTILYLNVNDTIDFDFTGDEQIYRIPGGTDTVHMFVWGAEGGKGTSSSATTFYDGGKGGYSYGSAKVNNGDVLYVYVGGKGVNSQGSTLTTYPGGFNGGGDAGQHTYSSYTYQGGSGGGGTDIRINSNTLNSRVIVAGGGGGAAYSYTGGYGGGATGQAGGNGGAINYYGQGGTQTAGGAATTGGSYAYGTSTSANVNSQAGSLGQGGNGGEGTSCTGGGGGGGGFFGGSGGKSGNSSTCYPGGGGSGFVYTASNANCSLPASYYLANAQTVAGNVSFTSPTGTSETGHTGDGYARIIARGSREFVILVLDNTVAEMTDTTLNICNNQSATLEINFQGMPPFAYRITGDTADRICNTRQAHVTVSPTVTTNYQVTYVAGDVCEGKTSSTYTTVMVCNQPIICAGDTAYLPSGSTWYYDPNMSQAVADTFVTPVVTTTYYGNNNATFTVTVNPVATAQILADTFNICDSTAVLQFYFTGTTPFYYRITGDTADRVAYSDTVRMPVSPDTSTQYHITAFHDVYCPGTFNNDVATVLICDQPVICKGDTVWLDPSKIWFYDSTMLDTIRTNFLAPTQTTTYYNGGGNGGDTLNFRYTGSVQTFTVPAGVDSVFMQVWGAQGGQGQYDYLSGDPGKGGFSEGKMHVNQGDVLYIYVGGAGLPGLTSTGAQVSGGFNGGGNSGYNGSSNNNRGGGSGGGATDIRVNSSSLYARAIVAGGGGGGANSWSNCAGIGGCGGGLIGGDGTSGGSTGSQPGTSAWGSPGGGGTQVSGGLAGVYTYSGNAGSFGLGAAGYSGTSNSAGGGGGGGWYGGGSGSQGSSAGSGAGGGGSGYVYTSSTASNYPSGCLLNSNYYLTDARTVAGNTAFPDTSYRGSTETGHQGNGYARIFTIGPQVQKYRITVKPSYSDTIRDTICAGSSFTHNDSVYTVQGTYYQYFESYDHCDSTEVIIVTVNDTLRDTIHPIICTGVTFDTNGHLGCVPVSGQNYAPYWRTGVYTQHLRDPQTGCFQNLVIDLTVSDTIRDTVWHTICPSGHFTINNETYRDTGTFRQHLRTAGGCDSILAIVIDRSDTLRETIYRNMCKGSYYPLNGYTYLDTGTYKQLLSNSDGCDSILTLVLTFSDTLRDTIHPIICAGDTFIHNGIKYYQTSMNNQYFVSRFGCDSLIFIDLTVRDTIFEHVYDTICAGASVTYNGETFTLPGDYLQILQATVHCDSFLTIHLHVNDTLRDTIYDTVCAGQTITVNNETFWIQGEYRQWLRDAGTDCFHNYVIYLTVNDTIRDTIEPWICAGQVFRWNRVPYSVAGWYRQEFRTPEGCDSILHIHLIVGDTLRDTIYFSECSGHNITVNGVTYDTTGWYRQNLKNFDDCDSILHIHLTIEDTLRGHVFDTICYGDTYTFNGSTYYIPGIYPYVTRNLEGCDSIAYLHLHVNDTIITHIYDTICRDDRYYYLDTSYDQTGVYYHLLYRTTGCDSTVVLHLFERDSIQSVHYDTICNNTTFRYYGQLLARTGRYPYRHTSVLTGCDSVEWLALTVLDYPVLSILDSGSYCEGGHATLKANTTGNYITWTSSPYDPTMNGQDHNFTIYVAPDRYTEYTATVDIRPYNCRSTEVHAVNKPSKVEARMSMSPEEITAENLQTSFTDVSVGTIMYREWLFHERVPTIPDKQFFGERTVNYTSSIENDTLEVRLIVVNDEGCYDTAINLYPVFRGDVWVPNAFTPGRIGANRLLKVGHYNLIEYEIFIYTREGLLVFHSDDPDISWDGTYNYKDCKTGSYVYVVHYRTKSRPSESYEKKGSVLLIR